MNSRCTICCSLVRVLSSGFSDTLTFSSVKFQCFNILVAASLAHLARFYFFQYVMPLYDL